MVSETPTGDNHGMTTLTVETAAPRPAPNAPDEESALQALVELFERKFDEGE